MFSKSTLYDQDTFYRAFMRDLLHSKDEVIIESPFITEKRMRTLLPIFTKLRSRNVRIVINTRNPNEHDGDYYYQAINAIWISLNRFVELFTTGPARILKLDRGTLAAGAAADLTIFSLERKWTYDVNKSFSKSRNSPYHGVSFRGGPVATIVNGAIVWQA